MKVVRAFFRYCALPLFIRKRLYTVSILCHSASFHPIVLLWEAMDVKIFNRGPQFVKILLIACKLIYLVLLMIAI